MLTENSSMLKSWLKLPLQVRSQTLPVVSICDAAHNRDVTWDGSLSQLFSRLLFSVSIQAPLSTEMTSLFTRRVFPEDKEAVVRMKILDLGKLVWSRASK